MFAIVSHDAGGAEILSSYVFRNKLECLFVLDGPALKIFERKLGPVKTLQLTEAICQADNILCGSSWQSHLEYNAVKQANNLNIPCITFLDHWVNYKERFTRNGESYLPDEIWVGDKEAKVLAKKLFANIPIRLVANPYFQDICDELSEIPVKNLPKSDAISILYVCEPVHEPALIQFGDGYYLGYTEDEALRFFLSNLAVFNESIKQIVIRPHPSESNDKYDWAQDEFELPIVKGGVKPLLNEIVESDLIVGCESMAMVIGLLANKRVISCIPHGGRACMLKHTDIEHLQELI